MASDAISSDTLIDACTAGDLATVQTLLEQPAYIAKALEVEERIEDDALHLTHRRLTLLTMFNAAASANSASLLTHLLSFAHAHSIPPTTLIRRAAVAAALTSSNSVAIFQALHAALPDVVNMDLGHAGTPLSQAVSGSRNARRYTAERAPLVRFLLERGADPNARQGADGGSPGTILRTAVQRSSVEVVELLLEHGARIAQSGAMHAAAEEGRVDVLEVLLRRGADVNERLWTNLEHAARGRTRRKRELGIVGEVSDDKRPGWSHETPLHYGVLGRQTEATAWLVGRGADAGIVDSEGWSARGMAEAMGDAGILEALASGGETG